MRRLRDNRIRVVPIPKRSSAFYFMALLLCLGERELWAELWKLAKDRRLSIRRVVQVLTVFSRGRYEAAVAARYLKSHTCDRLEDETVLYACRNLYQPYLASRLAPLFSNSTLVARAHGADLYEEANSTEYLPMRAANLKLLDQLHLVSEQGYEYVLQRFPEYRDKLHVSYLGTEDHGLAEMSEDRTTLRIASCSTISRIKRLPLLAEAIRLAAESIDIDWVHYGDGPEAPEVTRLAAQLPSNVRWKLAGHVPNDTVLDSYRDGRHHVFVNVSSSEGIPVSIMEAISFGIPVIATDVGGTSEIVRIGQNGILLAPDSDARTVAGALVEVAEMSDPKYAKMSRESRKLWESQFAAGINYPLFLSRLLERDESNGQVAETNHDWIVPHAKLSGL